MKKLTTLLLSCLLIFGYARAQFVNIPDSNFAKYLISQTTAYLYKDSANQFWMDTISSGAFGYPQYVPTLNCNNLNIKNLEGIEYFKKIWYISCDSNQLVSIPDLTRLQHLSSLSCKNNKLTSLPLFQHNIYNLDFSYNQVSVLPDLNKFRSYYYLNCSNNLITNIPSSFSNLNFQYFICDSNNISNVPAFYPDSSVLVGDTAYFSANGNVNLACLPLLPNYIISVKLNGTKVNCLPNIPVPIKSKFLCSPQSLPVCNATNNPNSCTIYNNYVNIPDSNFAKYLITQIPSCLYKDSNNLYWMDTTCSGVVNLQTIDCRSLNIKSVDGVQYFSNLLNLYCSNNQISSLPSLPLLIQKLFCDSNMINNFKPLNGFVQSFSCNHNQLKSLPNLPLSLSYLSCDYNQLMVLPALPDSLLDLYCENNLLSNLPTLPYGLQVLMCDNNQLINLPTLPNTLQSIICNNNQLSGLPTLPTSLSKLICRTNQLTNLPYLPNSLAFLDCDSNQLTSLPIGHNFDSLYSITCRGNVNLFCLPKIPYSLLSLDVSGTGINCIPNINTWFGVYQFPQVTPNIPVCSPTNNANQCQLFPIVNGKVFTDVNSNGIKDSSEYYRPFVQLNLNSGGCVITNSNGEYSISLPDTGTYTLTTLAPQGYKAIPSSSTFTFINYNTKLTLPDIAIQPINTFDSLSIYIAPLTIAHPGNLTKFYIGYQNVGSVFTNDTVKLIYDTAFLAFDSCSIPVYSIHGNTIITSINVLTPGSYGHFTAYFTLKQGNVSGNQIFISAVISSDNTSDTSNCNQTFVSSYDPNYKDATPELSPVQVVNGTFIDYNIHFQNTGNDTAFNIVLADTLSPLLKSNILQVVATSHPCNITLKDSIIYFEFLKINLPDSNRNNFRSNGFVHFRLLPQNNVPAGGRINNKASIYFDYNKPVVTNTASTLIKPYGVPVVIRNYNVVAERVGENQLLEVINTWTVSTEINTAYYTIQRSINGRDFENVGKVIAANAGSYSYTDTPHGGAGGLYYRLKITDKDGKVAYSDIKQITIQPFNYKTIIYPNPAKNYFTIKGYNVSQINVVDNTGRIVMSRKGLNSNALENKVNINVADGIYIIQVTHTDGTIVNEKLIIKQ